MNFPFQRKNNCHEEYAQETGLLLTISDPLCFTLKTYPCNVHVATFNKKVCLEYRRNIWFTTLNVDLDNRSKFIDTKMHVNGPNNQTMVR